MFLVDWEKYVYYRVTFREENFSGYCNPMKFLSVFCLAYLTIILNADSYLKQCF